MSNVGTRLLAQRRNGWADGGGAGRGFTGPSAHKFVQQFGAARHRALHYSCRHQRLRSTGSRMRGDIKKSGSYFQECLEFTKWLTLRTLFTKARRDLSDYQKLKKSRKDRYLMQCCGIVIFFDGSESGF
jgi:hypothetical protein